MPGARPISHRTATLQRVAGHARAGTGRAARAFAALEREQRWAVLSALALVLSMFLPWYSRSFTGVVGTRAVVATAHLSAFGAFSFVEGGVLVICGGVLAMMFLRGEGRPFHLPGGDGTVIAAAGGWAALLIFYRFFDKQQGTDRIHVTFGVTWGIFFALLAAVLLLYSGLRLRASTRPEPPLRVHRRPPGTGPPPSPGPQEIATRPATLVTVPASRPRYPPAPVPGRRTPSREDGRQLSFEDAPTDPRPREEP